MDPSYIADAQIPEPSGWIPTPYTGTDSLLQPTGHFPIIKA